MPKAMLATTATLALAFAAAPAAGFDFRLPASEYGKVSLAAKQSLGAADTVADQQAVFEPMGLLREDDPLRLGTRAVGRLDLLVEDGGEQFMSTCTATIVNGGTAVLTANHCIPGLEGRVVEASLLLDYFSADSTTIRLRVAPEALDNDPGLDFSLAALLDPVPDDVAPVPIAASDVKPGERLNIVHHPGGYPKKLTQYRCQAAASLGEDTNLRHVCDTLPGSSGAPIFNTRREIVGIHHTGGMTGDDPTSFNAGTRILRVLATTDRLQAADLASRAPAAPASGPASGSADPTGTANDVIGTGNAPPVPSDSHTEATGVSDSSTITGNSGDSSEDSLNQMIGN